MKNLILATVAIFIAGQASATSPLQAEAMTVKDIRQTVNLMPPIEVGRPVHSEIEVEVISTGCTRAKDFQVVVTQRPRTQVVHIERIQPDLCEMVPHRRVLTLETTALKSAKQKSVRMENPLLVEVREVH